MLLHRGVLFNHKNPVLTCKYKKVLIFLSNSSPTRMKIFINDKPIKISGLAGVVVNDKEYNLILSSKDEIVSKKLAGKVLVYDASIQQLERFLRLSEVKKLKKLEEITFLV